MTQSAITNLTVTWGKCTKGEWCQLNSVDLTHTAFDEGGVYLIWHGAPDAKVVYVGQAAVLRDRLTDHRSNKAIQAYAAKGLYVTWAPVAMTYRDGVEVGLATRFKPLVGDRHPNVPAITVNGPWDA